jgi:hypothetical protein
MTNKPWTCDRCGEIVKIGDALYGLATNHEKRTTRHHACHGDPFGELRESLKNANKAADRTLDRLAAETKIAGRPK